MVFKPFSHLARRSTKAFTHGYAQSLAAASQSSYASTQTPLGQFNHHRLGKTAPAQQKESFHSTSIHATSPLRSTLASAPADTNHDGGLDAYLAAWQKHQLLGEDWQHFLSRKRAGWSQVAGLPAKLLERDEKFLKSGSFRTGAVERAYSTSAIEDIKEAHDDAIEDAALKQVNDAIAQEIESFKIASASAPTESSAESASIRKVESAESSKERTPFPEETEAENDTLASAESELTAHVDHITMLEQSGRHGQIPAVFESMLRAGLTPPTKAYNSLIVAAIRLSNLTSQVVPKALDIYSDMLRRKAVPDGLTYTLLLEILSVRTLEISEMKMILEQNKLRFRHPDGRRSFLLRSRATEQEIVSEDDSLNVALRLFSLSTQSAKTSFPATTYRVLLEACAKQGHVDHMIRVYSHMEVNKVIPLAASYPPMIQAFAESGDLRSAVECYDEYKSLAISDDKGVLTLLNRADQEVYTALVRSYLACHRPSGAEQFIGKVLSSLIGSEQQTICYATADTLLVDGMIAQHLDNGAFSEALEVCERPELSAPRRIQALEKVAITAADHDATEVASQAYRELLASNAADSSSVALLAMYVRQGNITHARDIWGSLPSGMSSRVNMVEPTAAYALALIDGGFVDEALVQARLSFGRIRAALRAQGETKEIPELIDESIELVSQRLTETGASPSPHGAMSLMWAMVENGGLITPVAEKLLAGLGPQDINKLSWQDLKLALQVEAGIVTKVNGDSDVAHLARFSHILETVVCSRMPLDKRTSDLVNASLQAIGPHRPDLVRMWDNLQRIQNKDQYPLPAAGLQKAATPTQSSIHDTFDPYVKTLDQKGSTVIVEELEKQAPSSAACLHEALSRFRNIRRAGRHPRYIAYAKLISAAAREGRVGLINDIFEMAKRDVPLIPQYPVVRHGWINILDVMVGAYLTVGNRNLAATFHQQLLEIGAAPSANTFGLYITTLKESAKTFDEATEAVKIFLRAKVEGVEPSSFLYNALIGKLGKARRIDDCLFYFAEMRARGVRPTSVTYGTIVNALCRVSDERFAEELFDEMESMPNYKPRPAPYNSMMQFFLTTKRDSSKVLEYYKRMQSRNIQPTMHTYKLLIDTYATLEPVNLAAAEAVFDTIRSVGQTPEGVHYASLIHAKGCVLHDMTGARAVFDEVIASSRLQPQACMYQALFESMVANHCVKDTDDLLQDMSHRRVEMTPYIANTLIHGWALERNIEKAKSVYDSIGQTKREPSTYEAMTRAFLVMEDRESASRVVNEMLSRGYPAAVSSKITELLGHGGTRTSNPSSESSLSPPTAT